MPAAGSKRAAPPPRTAPVAPSASRAAKEARMAARSRADPLDPASWEGYHVPQGGWSKGLPADPGAAANRPAGAAPAKQKGPLPSPGEILRMNAANQGK
eukprot:6178152-Pleurochrysis_carterae.AAC.1